MIFRIEAMRAEQARIVSRWIYEPPYQIYSFQDTEEVRHELLTENYHAVSDACGEVVGFFCYGRAARVPQGFEFYTSVACDIGLALAPELCGKGLGKDFMQSGLAYGQTLYPEVHAFRLSVMEWNHRAITLYRHFGFVEIGRFQRSEESGAVTFLVMERRELSKDALS